MNHRPSGYERASVYFHLFSDVLKMAVSCGLRRLYFCVLLSILARYCELGGQLGGNLSSRIVISSTVKGSFLSNNFVTSSNLNCFSINTLSKEHNCLLLDKLAIACNNRASI